MKKTAWIFAGAMLLTALYTFPTLQAETPVTGKYIIVRYNPVYNRVKESYYSNNKQNVYVSYGDRDETIVLTWAEANESSSYIANLFTTMESDGFQLVSTSADASGFVNCYLRKAN